MPLPSDGVGSNHVPLMHLMMRCSFSYGKRPDFDLRDLEYDDVEEDYGTEETEETERTDPAEITEHDQ